MKLLWILIPIVVVLGLRDLLTDPENASAPTVAQQPKQANLRKQVQPRINTNEVKAKLHRVRTALHQYNVESGEIPVGLTEIVDSGYLQTSDVRDPWGREFAFRSEETKTSNALMKEYEIFVYSSGPDGVRDNRDDIYL